MTGDEGIIERLRGLNALVLHPRDGDAEELLLQLNRIGCRAQAVWPPPKVDADPVDIAFILVQEKPLESILEYLERQSTRPSLIGLAGYESPSVLNHLISLQVDSVLTKPIRPSGVLTSMVTARRIWQECRHKDRLISKLRSKVENSQKLNDAKLILMRLHEIGEQDAYRAMRQQAMESRQTVTEVAEAIIQSHSLLTSLVSHRDFDADPGPD
ncbi:ANTAR domain-containing response regulator [Spiribacter insolitus]|uniref:ANTAR domain-containing protein n=1 Tax=Spiribacter insolitus TaxID=3122417 RepID=A0ABV3T5G1_9GAMM